MKGLLALPVVLFLLYGSTAFTLFSDGLSAYQKGDYTSAMSEFSSLAEKGHASALFYLSIMHAKGYGVTRDYKAAFKWCQKAAEQGLANAQFSLGVLYSKGVGIIQNYTYAYMWLDIAASQGHQWAKKSRDSIEVIMTQADILKAQELARECAAKDYKDC